MEGPGIIGCTILTIRLTMLRNCPYTEVDRPYNWFGRGAHPPLSECTLFFNSLMENL
jgi:hypothetical protein